MAECFLYWGWSKEKFKNQRCELLIFLNKPVSSFSGFTSIDAAKSGDRLHIVSSFKYNQKIALFKLLAQ